MPRVQKGAQHFILGLQGFQIGLEAVDAGDQLGEFLLQGHVRGRLRGVFALFQAAEGDPRFVARAVTSTVPDCPSWNIALYFLYPLVLTLAMFPAVTPSFCPKAWRAETVALRAGIMIDSIFTGVLR